MHEIEEIVLAINQILNYDDNDWDRLTNKLSVTESHILRNTLDSNPIREEELAIELGFESAKSPNFRRYRRALRQQLLNQLLNISLDVQASSSFQRAYYASQKQLSVFNILRGTGRSKLSFSIAHQLLKTARRYFLTEIRLELSRYLGRYYSTNNVNTEKANRLFNESEDCLKTLQAEMAIERIYSQLMTNFINDKSIKKDISIYVLHELETLKKHLDKPLDSYKFYLLYFNTGRHASEGMGDFEKALHFSKEGFRFFDNLHFDNRTAKYMFLAGMAESSMRLGKLEEAYKYVNQSLEYLIRKGHINWFRGKSLLSTIELFQKNYDSAFRHYLEILQYRTLSSIPEDKLSVIRLQGAYLEFLRLTGEVQIGSPPTRFRINKFINEVPQFNADKRGMRIPLIIAQLLYNIYDRDYDAIEDRIYALKDYCSRNLMRKSENFRSNCFIKMLLLIPTNNFNPVAARRKTNNLLNKMREVPYELSEQSTQVEIIPYEDLWEIVLKYLKSPKRKRVSKYSFN